MINDSASREGFIVIAVDGGAASGKSSTSRLLAERLNLLHVDTGAHYRIVALVCLEAGILPEDNEKLKTFLRNFRLSARISGRQSHVRIGNEPPPPGPDLRAAHVNKNVSRFAALPAVREAVKVFQRNQVQLARDKGFNGIVMDGRDIGTVILPDADLKIFLTADAATRQKRRFLEGTADTIADRDTTDSSRTIAPLRPAPDAVIIDNSRLSLEQVVEEIIRLVENLPR